MDNDNLFEEFENNNNDNFLNKKHLIEKEDLSFNKNKKQKKEKNSEEIEDILLLKQIENIKNSYNQINNNYNIEEEDINLDNNTPNNYLDNEISIKRSEFPGGIHELLTPTTNTFIPQNNHTSPTAPATTYPFELDHFQKKSIECLEKHQSVIVSAHTSAGKTVVAEYAIAMALRDKQRVIYTSPIKALSNQKYRELLKKYKDVGLMTGDVSINSNASCIVMTTEILRNMLYKGSEIVREIAWVIFDEVHYMRDKIRGVIWEETIILLNNYINYVFLSATIPNAREFAMWVTKIKNQCCNVIYTDFRPVPLQHYIFPSGGNDINLIVDSKGNFREENFNKCLSNLAEINKINSIINYNNNEQNNENKLSTENDLELLIDMINSQSMEPAIIFCFSKEQCEKYSNNLKKFDLITNDEKKLIEKIFISAIMSLSNEDQKIKQIQSILPILQKGIGIHHSGMLPIIREIVELIFQEGLIKILFTTETFSMGVNMPAKTVIFTDIEKFDGLKRRYITCGEYIQMSGRAGRRGLDEKGIVILILKKKMEIEKIREIFSGKSDCLNSSFHLSYNQILNLSRIEGVKCEFILKRSFRQFQSVRAIPVLKKKIIKMYQNYEKLESNWERDELIKNIINVEDLICKLNEENRKIVFDIKNIKNIKKFINSGRLVKINKLGIGIIIEFAKKNINKIVKFNTFDNKYEIVNKDLNENKNINENDIDNHNKLLYDESILYILIYIDKNEKHFILEGDLNKKIGKSVILPFSITDLDKITTLEINIPKNSLINSQSQNKIEKLLLDINKNLKGNFKYLDNIKDLNIKNNILINNSQKLNDLEKLKLELDKKLFDTYNISSNLIKNTLIKKYKEKSDLRTTIKLYLKEIENLNKLILHEELNNMKRLLKRLNYISNNEVVTLKGQVACQITSSNEIVLTEMLFEGSFNNIEENYLTAMLSCFLIGENKSYKLERQKIENIPEFMELYDIIKKNVERVYDILIECKINIKDKENYLKDFKYDFMNCIYEWVLNEKSFADILNNTEIYGGSLVRYIRTLDELIKELIECCEIIGNNDLKIKLINISKKIRKGIPFAASLYLVSNNNEE